MPRNSVWVSLLAGLLASATTRAQETTSSASPIATDRPAFTDSSVVVPSGTVQFENGILGTINNAQQSTVDFPETLIRFGIAPQTELRFTVPDYFAGFGSSSGFADVLLGIKQQLGPTHGFDVSLVAALSFPTGSPGITSGGYDPELQLPWSRQLTKNWTAAGMLAVYWPTQGQRRNVTGQSAWEFDRTITNSWDAFVEYDGQFPQRGGTVHILHFGTAYRLTNNQQLDFHVGFGVSSATPDRLIGVGYSFRFRMLGR
ncbi:MAG TPA: transporter [Candidatus Eremiobacteraceae bacterium]|nr:transporter [Candidatus Eremiobacteraceae bacterium]